MVISLHPNPKHGMFARWFEVYAFIMLAVKRTWITPHRIPLGDLNVFMKRACIVRKYGGDFGGVSLAARIRDQKRQQYVDAIVLLRLLHQVVKGASEELPLGDRLTFFKLLYFDSVGRCIPVVLEPICEGLAGYAREQRCVFAPELDRCQYQSWWRIIGARRH